MSDQYSGLQARIKQVNNLVEWVPCAAHLLKLEASRAAECCPQAVSFFGLIQSIYTFCSASTGQWTKMISNLTTGAVVLKRAADTRWSSHYDACHAFAASHKIIRDTLSQIASDMSEMPSKRHEAKSYNKKMQERETDNMSLRWGDIIVYFHKISRTCQTPVIKLDIVVQSYLSLTSFFKDMRGRFQHYEQGAKTMVENDCYCADTRRKCSLVSFHDDSKSAAVALRQARIRSEHGNGNCENPKVSMKFPWKLVKTNFRECLF
ncbi:hypothetical protein HELRODRAFT_160135 [Helobdella robusta]|uniref:DUF659 domain-containing protein n=1 Tax=Helobdella robusta TaxID=6412 RepID=T1EPV0_HELRO|nr:hypothetical protein HELRODRAFT_160135 [Helobdella robusta]ESO06023.1 hypothetical protein HELRODRAFT_160135 [Helobdella robusta]